ncbi:carboxymuconolactone decarboxylase family protein [Streptomyces flaveolus]|uniref:carboxymuconolactone decarboxylase family protein n=1 Tax=Streptomyces flaveolus TaxID=67297 RepID=UPI0033AA32E3
MSSEVGEAAAAAGLDPLLVELLRIRSPQINGCAFCLRMHTRDALRKGENPDRIAVLPGRAETGRFSETDRAALRLTEAITRVPDGHVSDEDDGAAAAVLIADQVPATAWLATVMNAFNRAAVNSRYPVGAADLRPRRPVRSPPVPVAVLSRPGWAVGAGRTPQAVRAWLSPHATRRPAVRTGRLVRNFVGPAAT